MKESKIDLYYIFGNTSICCCCIVLKKRICINELLLDASFANQRMHTSTV